jgi:predicted ATPase
LHAICADERLKQAALGWVQALTPVDVVDFEFVDVGGGRISLTLVESGGHKTSADSASDGTLRFLGTLAALIGPNRAKMYFFEEIENAIHPTRLHLLVDFLEQQVARGEIQIVATTHAPQVLGYLSAGAREDAVLTYRLEGRPDAGIRRLLDIPEARHVLEIQDVSRLHASGWLENAVTFLEGAECSY